jgi:hypothetical protein
MYKRINYKMSGNQSKSYIDSTLDVLSDDERTEYNTLYNRMMKLSQKITRNDFQN